MTFEPDAFKLDGDDPIPLDHFPFIHHSAIDHCAPLSSLESGADNGRVLKGAGGMSGSRSVVVQPQRVNKPTKVKPMITNMEQ